MLIIHASVVMRNLFKCFLCAVCFLGAFGVNIAIISPAKADFRICNETNSLVGAALGYRKEEKWISEGWFQIAAKSCASLIQGDLSTQFYYIYAEDAERGGQWRGDVFLCTKDREFKIEGIENCFQRGFMRTGFFEIDTGNKSSWMVRLTEQSRSSPN